MRKLCDAYIRAAGLIGVLYSLIPTLVWFGGVFLFMPFREVYLIRLLLCLSLGCYIAMRANRYGVSLWLSRHASRFGPATVADGAIIGAGVGLTITLLPALTSLIASNHLEEAKWFIIGAWLAGMLCGSVIGGIAGALGRRYVAPDGSMSVADDKAGNE